MKRFSGMALLVLAVVGLFARLVTAGEINLSAAASLREAMTELSTSCEKTPGVKFQDNFGASGALAKQIENGAPVDLFISANTEWMEYLKERQLVDGKDIRVLAYNELVFVANPESTVKSLRDVGKLDKIAIGSPRSVPAGEYAMEALKKAGMEKQLQAKLVMARDVRECLLYAERGEVDGAFVYKTDLEMAKNVKVLFSVPGNCTPGLPIPWGSRPQAARRHRRSRSLASSNPMKQERCFNGTAFW